MLVFFFFIKPRFLSKKSGISTFQTLLIIYDHIYGKKNKIKETWEITLNSCKDLLGKFPNNLKKKKNTLEVYIYLKKC